jgi:hypothetical protein
MIMSELDIKKQAIANVLNELSQNPSGLSGKNDDGFDVEQADCACCCSLILGTGGALCIKP